MNKKNKIIKKPKLKLIDELKLSLNKLSSKKEKSIEDLYNLKLELINKIDKELYLINSKKNSFVNYLNKHIEELKKYKKSVWRKFISNSFKKNFKYLISMPFIYVMWIPAFILHIFLEIYHQICFRLYGIPLVNPKDYFIFDRVHLSYLNWLEKFNCFFCSYFNCLIAYTREIAGRTERFWCPIKHTNKNGLEIYHKHYHLFSDFSDGKDFRKKWDELREFKEFNK